MDIYDKDKEKVNPAPYARSDEDYDANRGAIDADAERLQNLFSRPDIPALNLKAAEKAAEAPTDTGGKDETDKLGKGFTGGPSKGRFNLRGKMRRRIAVGVLTGSLLGGGIFGFLSLQPLRVMTVTTNAENTFFASFNRADSNMNDTILRYYIVKSVVPGMVTHGCKTTSVSKSCASVGDSKNMITATWRTWRDVNLEGKMADKGFEIRREGNRFYIRAQGINDALDLGTYDKSNTRKFEDKAFAQLDRSEIREMRRSIFQGETKAKQMRNFFAVNDLLARKYGVRHCIVACDTRDKFTEAYAAKKLAFKGFLFERYITPHTDMLGLAFECAMSGFDCTNPEAADANGERLSKYEKSVQARLIDYRASHAGTSSLEDLEKEASEIREKGLTQYIIKSLAGETAAKISAKVIPVVGWIDLGANLLAAGSNIGPALRKINYVMNAAGMVQLFALYRTSVDEQKAGKSEATILGSISDSFNAVPGGDQGGAAAEASPAYWQMMGSTSKQVAGLQSLTGTASAEVAKANCDDAGGYPVGSSLCPQVTFSAFSSVVQIAKYISDAVNQPALMLPVTIAKAWTSVTGSIFSWISSVLPDLSKLLPLDEIMSWIQNVVFAHLFINPLTAMASGVRLFEMMFVGADVAGNDAAHYKLGGRALNSQEVMNIRAADQEERNAEFQKLPLYARLFDKNESQSLVSQVAVAMPSSSSGFMNTLAGFASLPMRIGSIFTSFGRTPASAKIDLANDPAGITQYGYPENDPIFNTDPEANWDKIDCSNPENVKIWGDKATRINDVTGMPEHDVTNPCMLYRSAVSSGAGLFNKDLILPSSVPGATSGSTTSNAGVGSSGSFTFPLKTTQSAIKSHTPTWCFSSQTSCHHDYPAADIFTNQGTEVVAAVGGTLVTYHPDRICNSQSAGFPSLQIKGDDGNYYFYAHFAQGSLLQAKVGDKITQGQKLGVVGPTQCAEGTPSHLHIQKYTSIINGNSDSMEIQPPLVAAFGALPQ